MQTRINQLEGEVGRTRYPPALITTTQTVRPPPTPAEKYVQPRSRVNLCKESFHSLIFYFSQLLHYENFQSEHQAIVLFMIFFERLLKHAIEVRSFLRIFFLQTFVLQWPMVKERIVLP